jgi:hypothetical protein
VHRACLAGCWGLHQAVLPSVYWHVPARNTCAFQFTFQSRWMGHLPSRLPMGRICCRQHSLLAHLERQCPLAAGSASFVLHGGLKRRFHPEFQGRVCFISVKKLTLVKMYPRNSVGEMLRSSASACVILRAGTTEFRPCVPMGGCHCRNA